MLILPPGHAQAVRAPIRGRWMLVFGGVLTVALVVIALVAITSQGHHTSKGCVDVVIPYAVGGQEIYNCGAAARSLCSGVDTPAGFSGSAGAAIATECRKAGLRAGGGP